MEDELTKTLKLLLQTARGAVEVIYEDEDFMRSNMDLAGHLFVRLTNSSTYKRQYKYLNDEMQKKLVKSTRMVTEMVANEYLRDTKVANDYELRVLESLRRGPMWDFQIVKAVGCDLLISASVDSAIKALVAKKLIYRGDDYKYYIQGADK